MYFIFLTLDIILVSYSLVILYLFNSVNFATIFFVIHFPSVYFL